LPELEHLLNLLEVVLMLTQQFALAKSNSEICAFLIKSLGIKSLCFRGSLTKIRGLLTESLGGAVLRSKRRIQPHLVTEALAILRLIYSSLFVL
jgi:hypothetical protein